MRELKTLKGIDELERRLQKIDALMLRALSETSASTVT
jgi:hypothetical protein